MNRMHEFDLKLRSIPNDQLMKSLAKNISDLCRSGGKSFTMTVPPSTNDTDMIVCESLRRMKAGMWHKISENRPTAGELIEIYYPEGEGSVMSWTAGKGSEWGINGFDIVFWREHIKPVDNE
tara:strand:+ start:292 stop:657 length:366 start_codon:yes stop_codon:yes gene_type:complete